MEVLIACLIRTDIGDFKLRMIANHITHHGHSLCREKTDRSGELCAVSGLAPIWVRLAPKITKPGLFRSDFSTF